MLFNDGLYELDPMGDITFDSECSSFFKEDMLQLENSDQKLVLDIGWYPEGNLAIGEYCMVLVKNQNWDNPIFTFRTRHRLGLVAEIERILARPPV